MITNRTNRLMPSRILAVKVLFYGSRCAICGEIQDPDTLDFAHVKPTELSGRGRGRKERYYDVVNNLDCYRCMCREGCHKFYDDELKENEWWDDVE